MVNSEAFFSVTTNEPPMTHMYVLLLREAVVNELTNFFFFKKNLFGCN